MASKTLLIILALALVAVALSVPLEEELSEELTLEDVEDYFNAAQMEKRGSKVGKCTRPDGKACALCNLKVRNKMDMRRYIACSSAGRDRMI